MKRFFLRQISLVLVIAMLFSLVGVAEDSIIEPNDSDVDEIAIGDESLLIEDEIPPEEIGDMLLLDEIPLDGIDGEVSAPEETVAPDEEESVDPTEGTNASKGVPKELTLGVKMTYTLDTSKLAKGKTVTYKSSKAKVAKVSKKGVITAVKKGIATITCYVGKKKIATCKVTVVPAPSKVKLPWKTLDIGKKESVQLVPIIKDGTMASYTYTTKDKKVATVSTKGVVKGIKVGKKTTITVTTQNKKKVNLTVNVLNAPKKVTLDQKKATITVGETLQLKATLPKKTASQLTWKSGNKKVATVNENGIVTAVGAGTAKITVSTFNKKKATCTVTVNTPVPTATPEPVVGTITSLTIKLGDVVADDETIVIPNEAVTASWIAEGDVASYYYRVLDASGTIVVSKDATSEKSYTIAAGAMAPGDVYTLEVGAIPTNGTAADILWKTAKFKRNAVPVVGTITSLTIRFGDTVAGPETIVLPDTAVTASWTAEGNVASYAYEIRSATTTIASGSGADATSYNIAADALTAGEEYTLTVKAIPTNGTENDATTATAKFKRNTATVVGTITSLTIKFGDTVAGNETVVLPDTAVTASWSAEGDVASYSYEIKKANGESFTSGSGTSYVIAADALTAGEEYTLTVKAIPTNGTENNATTANVKFKRNAAPVVGTITSLTIKFGDTTAGTETVVLPDTAVTASWIAEGDVANYAYEIRSATATIASGSGADATSYIITADALTLGEEYTLTVKAIPTNGTENNAIIATAKFKRNAAPVVGTITSLTIKFDDTTAGTETVVLPDTAVTASWSAEGDVASYSYEIKKANGDTFTSGNGADATSYVIAADALTAGEEYTLTVKAIPTNGSENEATITAAKFKRDIKPTEYFSYNVKDSKYAIVTGFSGTFPDMVVPEKLGGYPVQRIAANAFSGNKFIEHVYLPDGLKEIGNESFRNCDNLVSIVLPDSIEKFGYWAFSECDKLEAINYPTSLQSIEYGYPVFNGCVSLKQIVVPEGVTKLASGVFKESSLNSITLPSTLKSIGNETFSNCDDLVSIVLPDSIEKFGYWAFSECDKLEAINYPTSLQSIEYGYPVFNGCVSLKQIVVPEGVTTLPGHVFESSSLSHITLPETLKDIGYASFGNCESLLKVYLGVNVTSIDNSSFDNCPNLTIWTEYGTTALKYSRDNGLNYYYLTPDGVNSPSGTLYKGDNYGLYGYARSSINVSEVTATIWDSTGTNAIQSITVNPASKDYNLAGTVNASLLFGNLELGNYRYTLKAKTAVSEEVWADQTFTIAPPPLRVSVSGLGDLTGTVSSEYALKGTVYANYPMSSLAVTLKNVSSDTIYPSFSCSPNSKTYSLSNVSGISFADKPTGNYQLTITVSGNGETRTPVNAFFSIGKYDGNINSDVFNQLVTFTGDSSNRSIFDKYREGSSFLGSITITDAMLMAINFRSEMCVDIISQQLREDHLSQFMIKRYKKEIAAIIDDLDVKTDLTGSDSTYNGLIDSMTSNLRITFTLNENDSFVNKRMMNMSRIIYFQLDKIENLCKINGWIMDAKDYYRAFMQNYENSMMILEMYSGYNTSNSPELRAAVEELANDYDSKVFKAMNILTNMLLDKMSKELYKDALKLFEAATDLIDKKLTGQYGGYSIMWSAVNFAIDAAMEMNNYDDIADSLMNTVVRVETFGQALDSYHQAFDAVRNGNTSSSALNRLGISYQLCCSSGTRMYDALATTAWWKTNFGENSNYMDKYSELWRMEYDKPFDNWR